MKFNWGTGLVIAIVAFMAFILQYVIRVQTDNKFENELVTESYYEKELEVNTNTRHHDNLQELGNQFSIKVVNDGVVVQFPKNFDYKNITGKVSRSEEHTSELQSREKLVCRLLLEKTMEKCTQQ